MILGATGALLVRDRALTSDLRDPFVIASSVFFLALVAALAALLVAGSPRGSRSSRVVRARRRWSRGSPVGASRGGRGAGDGSGGRLGDRQGRGHRAAVVHARVVEGAPRDAPGAAGRLRRGRGRPRPVALAALQDLRADPARGTSKAMTTEASPTRRTPICTCRRAFTSPRIATAASGRRAPPPLLRRRGPGDRRRAR